MSAPQHTPAGRFFYRPFIPLQVTGKFLDDAEPDAVERLAAVADAELRAKHDEQAAAKKRHQEMMERVRQRHGKKLTESQSELLTAIMRDSP